MNKEINLNEDKVKKSIYNLNAQRKLSILALFLSGFQTYKEESHGLADAHRIGGRGGHVPTALLAGD